MCECQWRDIETAPKDGTTILVAGSDWVAVSNSFMDGGWWTWHPPMIGHRPTRSNNRAEQPTHWRPLALPLPPSPSPEER